MPTVFNFAPNPNNPDQAAFISTFTQLMQQLEQCWTSSASIGSAIGTMFTLQENGVQLIQNDSATPQFVFQ